MRLSSLIIPASAEGWAADGKTETLNLPTPPCRPASPHFIKGNRPTALSKALPPARATSPSQALVPAQPHRRQTCTGCQDLDLPTLKV